MKTMSNTLRYWVVSALGALLGVVAACSSSSTPSTASPDARVCTPGKSVACVGAGGCFGGQACAADGSGYGPCECGFGGNDGGKPDATHTGHDGGMDVSRDGSSSSASSGSGSSSGSGGSSGTSASQSSSGSGSDAGGGSDAGSEGGSGSGSSGVDASVAEPASCAPGGPGMTNCGTGGTESCCTSLEVQGGTPFYRAYDYNASGQASVGPDGGATNESSPATVSSYRLDKYDVTVGRFRQFVKAWNGGAGYTPPEGSGKHTHLNGGMGLANSASPGDYEPGWDTSNNSEITPTTANLGCSVTDEGTWTTSPSGQETLPINCVSAYEADAFCIWDGGFLPSDAELGYAEAGGAEQLEFPWGSAPPGLGFQYAVYGDDEGECSYPSGTLGQCGVSWATNISPVGTAVLGVGRWGQLDLLGNVREWTLDTYAQPVDPCVDCAYIVPPTTANGEVLRGCASDEPVTALNSAARGGDSPTGRNPAFGFRCARTP